MSTGAERVTTTSAEAAVLMEGGEGSEVVVGASSEGELRVWDIVAEVSMGFRERRKGLLGSGASICSSGLGLVERF